MAYQTLKIVDRLTRLTPLGLRFWDSVEAREVGEGLVVTAYPANQPQKLVMARLNRSSVYIFQNLPGMREVEFGAGDDAFWKTVVPRKFVIEVQDLSGRFLPFSFSADLPYRGLFSFKCGPVLSPPDPASPTAVVPLYSAPARPVSGGLGVIRAELFDPVAQVPAAWAWLEAQIGAASGPQSRKVRSFADELGRVSLIFPYPEPLVFTPGSPISAPALAMTKQSWPVKFKAGYTPLNRGGSLPDICDILAQPLAQLLADTSRTVPQGEVTLTFGQTLTVRSTDVSGPLHKPLPVLLITPAV